MLTPLVAGNWKMNTTLREGAGLVMSLRELIKGVDSVEILIAPPFTHLHHLSHLAADSPIKLAAQNVYWEKKGAFTGEISPEMLKDVGCRYVIIGHSERRQYFHETDETVNRKLLFSIKEGLKPIVCVGETLEEREAGKALTKVRSQLKKALSGIVVGTLKEVAVAYEPVWAIGTGRNASPEDAEEVHSAIKELLFDMFDTEFANSVRVIYGGSVKPDNMDALMAQPNIDGALVGGASLKAADFARIIKFQSQK
ncbi:MAG: triose-phosphate isomerase [Deltaproteobacteria bacterium]|nr:triose-phosphate isomerase [Deltaproteobacteria bacterium]